MEPALVPPESVYVALKDYGPDGGGWGPVTLVTPLGPAPAFTTRDTPEFMEVLRDIALKMAAQGEGPVIIARFSNRDDLLTFP